MYLGQHEGQSSSKCLAKAEVYSIHTEMNFDQLLELSSSECSAMGEVRLPESSFEHTKMYLCQHEGQSSSESLAEEGVHSVHTEMCFG